MAIVGSRAANDDALDAAHAVAAALARDRATIVSGLAARVDTAAHRRALDVGGHTTAVLGTGIRHTFPAENADLAQQIADSGAVISQSAPNAPRTSTTFLRRSTVIAGLSDISLVIDGKERSGSRHQSEQAANYGRTVLLWAPALHRENWAREVVNSGHAVFVDSVAAVTAAVEAHAEQRP